MVNCKFLFRFLIPRILKRKTPTRPKSQKGIIELTDKLMASDDVPSDLTEEQIKQIRLLLRKRRKKAFLSNNQEILSNIDRKLTQLSQINQESSNPSSPKVSITANERIKLNAVVDSLLDGCELEAIKPSAIPKIEFILRERHEQAISTEDYEVAQQLAEHLIKLEEIKENSATEFSKSFSDTLNESTSQSPKSSFQFEEEPRVSQLIDNEEKDENPKPRRVSLVPSDLPKKQMQKQDSHETDKKPPNIKIDQEISQNKEQPSPEKQQKTPTSPKKTRIPIFTRKSSNSANNDNSSVKSEPSSIDTESFIQTETEVMKIVNNIEHRISAQGSLTELSMHKKTPLAISIDCPVVFQVQLIDEQEVSSIENVKSDEIEGKIDAIPHISSSIDEVISVKKYDNTGSDHISMISIPNEEPIFCDLDDDSLESEVVKDSLEDKVEKLSKEVSSLKSIVSTLQREIKELKASKKKV